MADCPDYCSVAADDEVSVASVRSPRSARTSLIDDGEFFEPADMQYTWRRIAHCTPCGAKSNEPNFLFRKIKTRLAKKKNNAWGKTKAGEPEGSVCMHCTCAAGFYDKEKTANEVLCMLKKKQIANWPDIKGEYQNRQLRLNGWDGPLLDVEVSAGTRAEQSTVASVNKTDEQAGHVEEHWDFFPVEKCDEHGIALDEVSEFNNSGELVP